MSACRSMLALGLVVCALAGCSSGDDEASQAESRETDPTERTGAESREAAESGDVAGAQGDGDASARRGPVRLLLLGRFDAPTYLTAPAGDTRRRFVVERDGRIVVVRGRRKLREPFLDISDRVSPPESESGMLSMAFANDYDRSGLFYVYYTDNEGYLQIDQFRRSDSDPDRADEGSRRSVIRVPHPRSNHKGGQVQVGPDGHLYAGFGDGGSGGDPDENAQNLGRMLGKLIRIDPNPGGGYSIPADNPLRGRAGARPEIFAYGLRNPYRFSFDRARGSLSIADVGQDAVEEVSYLAGRSNGRQPRGGANFGWDVFEGRSRYEGGSAPGHVPPVIAHDQDEDGGFCSIIGGYVIRDPSLRGTRWFGRYVYGDFCNPALRLSTLRSPTAKTGRAGLSVSSLASFGEDGRGRVHAVSLDGPVYRIGRG